MPVTLAVFAWYHTHNLSWWKSEFIITMYCPLQQWPSPRACTWQTHTNECCLGEVIHGKSSTIFTQYVCTSHTLSLCTSCIFLHTLQHRNFLELKHSYLWSNRIASANLYPLWAGLTAMLLLCTNLSCSIISGNILLLSVKEGKANYSWLLLSNDKV